MNKIFIRIFLLLSVNLIFAEDANLENYREIECKLLPITRLRDVNATLENLVHGSHPHIPFLTADNTVSSNNWAGYVVGTNLFNPGTELDTVSFIQGVWTVPHIASSPTTTYCATWVGIDGFNNKTVEQIGTEQEFINGGQFNYAWVEMFPQQAQILSGFPVKVGDKIFGSVTFIGNNKFSLTLINRTQGIKTSVIRTLANPAQRICAEWIVEAPFLNGILPLGNFGKITFTGCLATIKGIKGAINNKNWTNTPITMISPTNVVKARPSALNSTGRGFSVTWHHN